MDTRINMTPVTEANSIRPTNRVNIRESQYKHRQIQEQLTSIDSSDTDTEIYKRVREEVRLHFLDDHGNLLLDCVIKPEKKGEFEQVVREYIQAKELAVPNMTEEMIIEKLYMDLCETGPLAPFLADKSINEIMLNGFDEPWIEQDGEDIPVRDRLKFEDLDHFMNTVVIKILNSCHKELTTADPLVDARIGSARVNIVGSPISQMKGPIVTIRKFNPVAISEDNFINYGTASPKMLRFMILIVLSGLSMIMGGSTGSGKTTTFRLLAKYIPKGIRTLVIEDTAELLLHLLYTYEMGYHFVPEECRIQKSDKDVTIQSLVENSLRQRPIRMIIGEIRKAPDLLSAIEAAFTGHPVWWTGHAETAKDMADRSTMQILAAQPAYGAAGAKQLFANSVNIIMMQKKYKKEKKRRIFEIVEVAGLKPDGEIELRPIFEFDMKTKQFVQRNPISDRMIHKFDSAEIPFELYEEFLSIEGQEGVA